MPSHTPAERRKRIREKLLKETLERQKKLEAQLGVAGVVRPPSVVSPRPLRVGPVPTASPRPIAPVSAVAPPRTPATPVRQPVPGEQERVFGLAQFGSISNQLNEIKRLEEAGTGRGTITEILGEKGLSATQASTLLGIRDREISGQITERRTPPPFEPFTRASNILDITGSLAASRFLPQVRELAEKHREEGRSTVTAARLALEEADLPPGVKILFRTMEPSILLPGVGIGGRLLRGALAPSGKSIVTQFLKKQAGERAEQLAAASRLPTVAERVTAAKPREAFAQPTVSQRLGVAPAPGLPVPPRTGERLAATPLGRLKALKARLAEVEALPPSTHPNKLNRVADTIWRTDQRKQLGKEIAELEARQVPELAPFAEVEATREAARQRSIGRIGLGEATTAAREVTELGRLKGQLTEVETALDDILSDVEYTTRFPGTEPRPYSVRYPGHQPGTPGYRPPTKKPTAYTAEEKAYIAAADKFDAEYPGSLRASIQQAQKNIAELEARQVAEAAPAPARAAALKPDEVTELGRLKRRLAMDEERLADPRPYSATVQPDVTGLPALPGTPGYRPPLVRTAAQRADDIVDAEDAVKAAKGEVADAQQGVKDGLLEPDDLTEAKSALTDARADLRQAKKPTGYTAEEKAYIAAADKFDAEYPKGLRASIQRAQKEIDALEARQVPDAPVTTATRAADAPVAATVRGSIRREIIDDIEAGRESTEFMFHSGSEVEGIIENGLRSGGLSTSPIAEAGYGNIIHVFRRSDLPSNISDLGADISFGRGFDPLNPPKPIASFTRKELGSKLDHELALGARAQELGYEQAIPDELIWSPKELAEGKLLATADERKLINRIEQAYAPVPTRPADAPVTTTARQVADLPTPARVAGLTPDEATEAAGREAAGAVPPTRAPGPAGVGAEGLASITPEQPTVASLGRKLDDLEIRVMELDAEIEVAGAGSLVRPKWAVGLTNPQVEEIARHENLNPFLPDWGDAVDSQFIASVKREGTFKQNLDTVTSLRQERAALNRDRPLIEAQLAELRIADAITKRTAEVTQRLTPSGGAIPPSGVGMPIGGRAVPTTGAYLPTLPTIEEVLAVNFKEDWVRTLGQRLARLPIVRKIFTEQVNPTVLAMDTPHKGIIAYLAIRDAADSAAIAGMKYIDELRHAFKVDRLGRVTNVQVPRGASADIGDVLTLPGAYPLNAVQREYARRVKALLTKNLDSQRQRGVKIKPITNFDEAARKISIDVDVGQGRYFPRVVIKRVVGGEEVEIGRGPIRGAIGAKQAQAKPRSWPTQRQGREQGGNIYLADPTETMRITLMAGRRAEADAILADFIRKQPGVATVVERLKTRWPDVVLERELSLAAERNRTFALKLLRRVVRGETPALQSMAKLRRDFPSMTEAVEQATGVRQAAQPALGEMRPTFRAPGGVVTERARRRILDRHITALLELENPSRRRMAEAKTQYTQKKLGVLADPATEEQLFQPAFQGLIMPKEMAEQITTHLTDRGPKLLESINDFNDVLRMLETGLDPGFLFIQGAITLLYRPIVWGKTTAITFRSLINPAVADAYFQLPATRATIDKMVQFAATPLSSSEFVAAASRGRLSRAPVVGGIFRGGAAAFNTFLDVARIEMHKSLGVMAKDDDAYRQLTTTIDQMFGVLSSRQLGVTPTRRALEGSLLMYAPRYRRAGAALMLSIFRGGLRGKIARQALSHFIFGSMAFMSGLAIALGQSDRLDPRKGRNGIPRMYDIRYGDFLSVKIGGSIIGVGGVTVSYLRLLGNLSRGLSDDGVKGVALTAFRSLRGLTSPFSSDVIDLVTGKAGYTEEDTRTPAGLAKMAASDILPFYVEPFVTSAIEELEGVKRQDVGIETFIFNLIGTRERGISPFEQRMMAREQWSINSGLTTLEGEVVREWTDMNRFQQKEAERQEPKLAQLIEEIDDLNYRRADRNTRVELDVVREEREGFEAEMTGIAESLIRGVPDATRRWYDKERKRLRDEHHGATNVLWAIRALGDAGSVEALQKWILENQRLEDAVSDLYFENRGKMQDAIPVLTSLDWDRIDAELDKWLLQTYGSAIRDYVLAHKDDWILSMPEEVRVVELQRQREIESRMWFRFYNLPPIIRQAPTGPAPTTPAPIPSSRQPSGLGRPPGLVP